MEYKKTRRYSEITLLFSRLMFSHFVSKLLNVTVLLMLLSSCSTLEKKTTKTGLPEGAWWSAEPSDGSHKIVISLEEQRVALFRGKQLVGLSPISSGREGHSTGPGNFRITEKDPEHRSSYYGAYVDDAGFVVVEDVDSRKDSRPPGAVFQGADMRYFMRVNGPIGMHQGYLPGYPASHGCIRLPGSMAALFFHATPEGTPVEIKTDASLIAQKPDKPVTLPEASVTEPETKPEPAAEPPPASGTVYAVTPKVELTKKKPADEPKKLAVAESPKKKIRFGDFFAQKTPKAAAPKAAPKAAAKPAFISYPKPPKTAKVMPAESPAESPTAKLKTYDWLKRPVSKPQIKAPAQTAKKALPNKPRMAQPEKPKKKAPKPGQTLYWNGYN